MDDLQYVPHYETCSELEKYLNRSSLPFGQVTLNYIACPGNMTHKWTLLTGVFEGNNMSDLLVVLTHFICCFLN